ncbi:MAG: helix-turn-helix domain-containing protein [Clostridiales bacterium]|nr:helix-turn-helix domain-containing protein [Candidatus Cacconaster stercorequi]
MAEIRPIAVSMAQAAQMAGVSRPTIYRWAKLDGFPVLHLGGCTRVLVDEFTAWLKKYGGAQ